MKKRRAISLLEVLFSMGVIAVGLLGVTAVLPLALNQIGRGRVLDNAARTGQNATKEFRVRAMGNPFNWRAARTVSGVVGSTTVNPAGLPNEGFCIDPLFVSTNSNTTLAPSYNAGFFPYYGRADKSVPRMYRISLAAPVTPINPSGMLRWAGAERIFVLQDELVFDTPEEKTAPPIQNFGSSGANRMYSGSTSWMATLSPNLDATGQVHDAYVLSVVVFDDRKMTMPMDGETERLLSVDWRTNPSSSPPQYFSGLGGGDLVLQSTALNDLLGIQSGKWIMLMGNRSSVTNSPLHQFRWYRVVTTDSEPVFNTTTNTFRLNVTVQGPDWNPLMATTCVFMPGVVSVYERSIRLETSSLWSN